MRTAESGNKYLSEEEMDELKELCGKYHELAQKRHETGTKATLSEGWLQNKLSSLESKLKDKYKMDDGQLTVLAVEDKDPERSWDYKIDKSLEND